MEGWQAWRGYHRIEELIENQPELFFYFLDRTGEHTDETA